MSGRNSWKLCNSHKNCNRCDYTLECWKSKASKHSATASALKYVNMCLINGNNENYNYEYEPEAEVPKNLQPIKVSEGVGEELPQKCGICFSKYNTLGENQMVVFNCGHSTCVSCFNAMVGHDTFKCPYCKKNITRAIKLYIQ
jgi:hypothetical protein